MSLLGIFTVQIEPSNPEYFRAYSDKPQLFPQTHAKLNLGDHFREALLGCPWACSRGQILKS